MGLPPSAHGHTDEEESEEVHEATLADFFDQFDGEDDDEGEDDDLPEDEAGPLQEPYDEAGPAEEAYDEALPEGEDVWDDEGGAAEEGPPEGVPSHRGDTGPAPTPESEDAGVVDPAARRRGRPSVPSWDDIMFGARDRRR
jgi:hypothetical protein